MTLTTPKVLDVSYDDETIRENIEHFWNNVEPELDDYLKEIPTDRLNLRREDHVFELRRRMYIKTFMEEATGEGYTPDMDVVVEEDEAKSNLENVVDEAVSDGDGGDDDTLGLDRWV